MFKVLCTPLGVKYYGTINQIVKLSAMVEYNLYLVISNQDLPLETRRCHIFPGLHKSLASIVVLCNHGCIACFDDNKVIITNK